MLGRQQRFFDYLCTEAAARRCCLKTAVASYFYMENKKTWNFTEVLEKCRGDVSLSF